MLTEEGAKRIAEAAQAEAVINKADVHVESIEPVLDDNDGKTLVLYITLSTGTVLVSSAQLPYGVGHSFPFRLN